MSNYKNQIEFIKRTRNILSDQEGKTKYEKTLLLNCCMGLLVAPQQWDKDEKFQIKEIADPEIWHVNPALAKENEHVKGATKDSVENIAYHFRNCLCHKLFEVLGDSEKIQELNIKDYSDEKHSKLTFSMQIGFSDFKEFVLKYSEEKIKLLEEHVNQ